MPRKPKKPCRYPGCPELTNALYCPAHQKLVTSQYNRHGRTPDMKKRYNGVWPAIRRRFIAAHPLCEMCRREGRITAAQEVHHMIPLADGGTHDESQSHVAVQAMPFEDHGSRGRALGQAQGLSKSQIESHHIAGPPLRVIFREFKKGI